MAIEGVLAAGRSAAESLMRDTGTMYAPNGRATQNESTGVETQQFTTVFTSKCKASGVGGRRAVPTPRTTTVGGVVRQIVAGGLHLPVSVGDIEPGWEFEVTAVGPLTDPQVLGKRYRIIEAPVKSDDTARRLDVVEV